MTSALELGVILHPCSAQDPPDAGVATAGSVNDDFTRVKPLLRTRCFACHGSLKQKAGLRVDTVGLMLRGGDSGPAVVKGGAKESLLLDRVSDDDPSERMPPEHEGEPLAALQVGLLRDWIAAGAPAPLDERPEADPRHHWAFRPIVRPAVPRRPRRARARRCSCAGRPCRGRASTPSRCGGRETGADEGGRNGA
jgi:hypothetical protein